MSNLWTMPLPTPGDLQYRNNIHQFMHDECIAAVNLNLDVTLKRGAELNGLTNSKLRAFKNQPIRMSVCGLQGCTAIAVVSEKGAWLAHVWEEPAMRSIGNLERDVLSIFRNGDPTIDPKTNQPWVTSLTSLVAPGQMFHADFKPRVLILTPGDPNAGGSTKSSTSSQSSVAMYDTAEGLKFKFPIQKICEELKTIIPVAFDPTIAGYTIYRLVIDYEITAMGKLMLQYTPVQTVSPDGKQNAMVRLYAFDNPDDLMQISFEAHPDQKL